ncbi:MAG: (d)CMP kinase [Clostridia bacterium]|nr:(d)CMP kinase [Clostridia bacterium]
MGFIVAIDGPAGTGKGTVTKLIAQSLKLVNIDTGAMYRCVTLECLKQGVSENEEDKIKRILENIDIKLEKEQKVFLNGKDVSREIRETRIDENVAKFAALKVVRDKLTPIQAKMGTNQDVIMEGRDIGTVVFPNANIKIFLDCSLEERAKRRYKQNLQKGIKDSYEQVLNGMIERHKLETEREIAPFVKAEDAILIDTTTMTIEEVVDTIVQIIEKNGYKKN